MNFAIDLEIVEDIIGDLEKLTEKRVRERSLVREIRRLLKANLFDSALKQIVLLKAECVKLQNVLPGENRVAWMKCRELILALERLEKNVKVIFDALLRQAAKAR